MKITIKVTQYKQYGFAVPGDPSATSMDYGQYVKAFADGHFVCQEFVSADSVWEPNTRNKGGGVGAFRESEPSDEKIDRAIKRITKKAQSMLRSRTWDKDLERWVTARERKKLDDGWFIG